MNREVCKKKLSADPKVAHSYLAGTVVQDVQKAGSLRKMSRSHGLLQILMQLYT